MRAVDQCIAGYKAAVSCSVVAHVELGMSSRRPQLVVLVVRAGRICELDAEAAAGRLLSSICRTLDDTGLLWYASPPPMFVRLNPDPPIVAWFISLHRR